MLLAAGMAAIYFSEHLGYGGAGPLGAVVAAFVSLVFWTKQGWNIEDNPASTAFEIFWMIVEPVSLIFVSCYCNIMMDIFRYSLESLGLKCDSRNFMEQLC